MVAVGENNILRFEFADLGFVGEFVSFDVVSIAKVFESFDWGSDFNGFEMREGELGHVVAGGAVFVDVDVVARAKDCFGEVFGDVFTAAGSAYSFDEFRVVGDAGLF